MLLMVLIAAIGAVLVSLAVLGLRRDRRLDEVDRFHRARQMTTAWSTAGLTRPRLSDNDAAEADRSAQP